MGLPTLPPWEKKFFHSVCSISWRKFLENQKYTHTNDKVMKWEDSAVKEAFDSAKMRFWGKLNDVPCSLPLPDPDSYIDKVDWDAIVDPKLFQDLEKEALPSEEERAMILDPSILLDRAAYSGGEIIPTGWDCDEEEEKTKPSEADLQENVETNSWDQHCVPFEQYQNNQTSSWEEQHASFEYAKAYNEDYEGWSLRENSGGGYNRRENMRWSRSSGGYYDNQYHMNRGRRNYKGGGGRGRGRGGGGRGRRGSFGYAGKDSGALNYKE